MRMPIVCSVAVAVTCAAFPLNGCHGPPGQRIAVIEAALREEAKTWNTVEDAQRVPCVERGVTDSVDHQNKQVIMTIPASSMPAPFTDCAINTTKSYLKIYEPQIIGNQAVVDIDFNCGAGGACGIGEYLTLNRDKSGWRVVGRRQTWMF